MPGVVGEGKDMEEKKLKRVHRARVEVTGKKSGTKKRGEREGKRKKGKALIIPQAGRGGAQRLNKPTYGEKREM